MWGFIPDAAAASSIDHEGRDGYEEDVKQAVMILLYKTVDAQQTILSYMELGEYRRAYISTLNCARLMGEIRKALCRAEHN